VAQAPPDGTFYFRRAARASVFFTFGALFDFAAGAPERPVLAAGRELALFARPLFGSGRAEPPAFGLGSAAAGFPAGAVDFPAGLGAGREALGAAAAIAISI
jgi:hypothetical protein